MERYNALCQKINVLKEQIGSFETGKVPAEILKEFAALSQERSRLCKNMPLPER